MTVVKSALALMIALTILVENISGVRKRPFIPLCVGLGYLKCESAPLLQKLYWSTLQSTK